MNVKTTVLAASIVSFALAGAVRAQGPDVVIFGLDTAQSIESNLATLVAVTERQSPTFERLVSGRSATAGANVLIGSHSGAVDFMSVTIDGAFKADELDKIAELEAKFGLNPDGRSIGACGSTSPDTCVALFYACPEAAPRCHVTVMSSKIMTIEETTVNWFREATDMVSR